VHGTAHTVLHLHVQLGNDIHIVDTGLLQITLSCCLNHVADDNALDGLILRRASSTVGTSDGLDMSTSTSVLSSVTSLLGHVGDGIDWHDSYPKV